MNEAPLRVILFALAGITSVATLLKPATLRAPSPLRQAPATLELTGYRVQPLTSKEGRRGHDLSYNTLRRWQIIPGNGEEPLTLTLVPVGARNIQDLQMAAFPWVDSDLSLYQRRLSSNDPNRIENVNPEQFALGRRRTDAAGSTTRLQTCITPGGLSGVTFTTLSHQLKEQQRKKVLKAPIRTVFFRVTGLAEHSRWECLAVQLATPAAPRSEQNLRRAWTSVRQALWSGT